MIFLVEDKAAEQALGRAFLSVMCIQRWARSWALQLLLASAVSCMLLHIKRYIVFMKFFTGRLTMEKPLFNGRESRGTTPLLLCEGLQMGTTCASTALMLFFFFFLFFIISLF